METKNDPHQKKNKRWGVNSGAKATHGVRKILLVETIFKTLKRSQKEKCISYRCVRQVRVNCQKQRTF